MPVDSSTNPCRPPSENKDFLYAQSTANAYTGYVARGSTTLTTNTTVDVPCRRDAHCVLSFGPNLAIPLGNSTSICGSPRQFLMRGERGQRGRAVGMVIGAQRSSERWLFNGGHG